MIMIEWTYAISLFVVLQMFVIMLQERFVPAFFLPKGVRLSRFHSLSSDCPLTFSFISALSRSVPSKHTTTTRPSLSQTPKRPTPHPSPR